MTAASGRPEAGVPPRDARSGRAAAPDRGFALLVVLWALVLISLLVLRLTESGSGEARLGANLRASAIAEADADGAFAESCVRLMSRTGDWSLAGGTHTLPVAGGTATVTVTNQAGLVDLNASAAVLLASLLGVLGSPAEQAGTVAQNIVAWRTPVGNGQNAPVLAPYRREGRAYGPPGQPFESVEELALVDGITPALLDRLRPHVTVFGTGDPALALADPIVKQAAAATGAVETAQSAADLAGDDVVALTVAVAAAGARFTRRGTVQLEPGVAPAAYRVLTWGQAAD